MLLGPTVDPPSGPGTVIVRDPPSGPDMMGHGTVMVRGTQSSYHCYINLYNRM